MALNIQLLLKDASTVVGNLYGSSPNFPLWVLLLLLFGVLQPVLDSLMTLVTQVFGQFGIQRCCRRPKFNRLGGEA